MARAVYWLSPPTRLTFMVSVILVTLTLLVRYAHVSIRGQRSRFRDTVDRLLGAAGGQSLPRPLAFPLLDCAPTTQCTYVPKAVLSEPVK